MEDDTDEKDVIVDKSSNNEDYEKIPSATGESMVLKINQ